jgi:hypothetical protein
MIGVKTTQFLVVYQISSFSENNEFERVTGGFFRSPLIF